MPSIVTVAVVYAATLVAGIYLVDSHLKDLGLWNQLSIVVSAARWVWDHWRMILSLDVETLRSSEQVRAFLDGSEPVDFNPVSRDETYAFVSRTLTRFDYAHLGKPHRRLVKGLLGKATGRSRA